MRKTVLMVAAICCVFHGVFAEKVAEFPDLFHPIGLVVDHQYIYISQDFNVFIYSAKDYQLVKQFGKKGEGPGECMQIPYIYLRPDHVVASTDNKIVYFSREGDFLRERITRPAGTWLVPFKDKFAARKYMRGEDGLRYHGLMLLDAGLKRIKDIYTHVHGFQGIEAEFNPLTISPPEFSACGDLLLMRNGERTKIIVFDPEGEKLFELTNPEDVREFTDADRQEFIRLSKGYERLKHVIRFPAYHPPIRWFYADPVGRRIYLETEFTENKQRRWRVYDFQGNFVKKIMLPVLSEDYTSWNFELLNAFHDGYCYQLKEEDETWGLHKIKVE